MGLCFPTLRNVREGWGTEQDTYSAVSNSASDSARLRRQCLGSRFPRGAWVGCRGRGREIAGADHCDSDIDASMFNVCVSAWP